MESKMIKIRNISFINAMNSIDAYYKYKLKREMQLEEAKAIYED